MLGAARRPLGPARRGRYAEGVRFGGIVLCGGASSRMGRPKALLPWRGGRPLVAHAVDVLRAALGAKDGEEPRVVVVGAPGLALPPLEGARAVVDREPGLGPLAGIREGLEALDADLAYVTATDAPFLTAEFVRAVLAVGGPAAPEADGFVHPLAAAYPTRLARLASELLSAGERRPLVLLEREGFARLPAAGLPGGARPLRNLNRPEDYLAALAEEGIEGRVTVELFGLARARAGVAELEVAPGRLREVLAAVAARAPALGDVLPHATVSIGGRHFAQSGDAPVAPGERVLVVDAAAGG